jgi:citrate synthase
MMLKEKLVGQIPVWRERVKQLVVSGGDTKVGEVNIKQIYGGMRDVKGLVTDISYVDPDEGIRLRGYTIDELLQKLPLLKGTSIPLVGGLYYLLLVGEIPTMEEAMEVENEWKARSSVPQYVFDVLRAMPPNALPMTMFSQAILAMQTESIFTRRYDEGFRKEDYWDATLEDSLNLTAKLPVIAAFIYHLKHHPGKQMPLPDPSLDWSANFAHMMGVKDNMYA